MFLKAASWWWWEEDEEETETETMTTTEFVNIKGEVPMYPNTISSPSRGGVGGNNARDGGRRRYDTHRSKAMEEGERG